MNDTTNTNWQTALAEGIRQMLDVADQAPFSPPKDDHSARTPERVVRSFTELFSGVGVDPASVLSVGFDETSYDEMISVERISFVSVCQHHLLPFYGTVDFAYIPDKRIVGLSKIPRMIEILARRPQIQERLTDQIVTVFQQTVEPLGCAAMVRAWHACAAIRGVRQPNIQMRTTALTGYFLDKPAVKAEFLMACGEHR